VGKTTVRCSIIRTRKNHSSRFSRVI